MKKSKKVRLPYYSKYLGLLGLRGFLFIEFFYSKNPVDLYHIIYFAWFGFFFLAKINAEVKDEMFNQHEKSARATMGIVALGLIITIWFISIFFPLVNLIPLLSASIVICMLTFCGKFYLLEKNHNA